MNICQCERETVRWRGTLRLGDTSYRTFINTSYRIDLSTKKNGSVVDKLARTEENIEVDRRCRLCEMPRKCDRIVRAAAAAFSIYGDLCAFPLAAGIVYVKSGSLESAVFAP